MARINMLASLLSVAVLVLLQGCEVSGDNRFRDQFRWIAGKWKGEYDGRTVIEKWSWKKHRYEGLGIELEREDTVFAERLYLEDHHGKSSYIAVLKDRPPVLFAGTAIKGQRAWEFENKEHDFPSRIIYELADDSTLVISILGPGGNGHNGYSYTLKRSK